MPTRTCCGVTVTEDLLDPALHPALVGQPLCEVERDGCRFVLLGTAHVSQASVEAVRVLLAQRRFDAVAVELCGPRLHALQNPDALAQLDLFRVLREGKTGLVAANLALSAYQRRLSEQLGVEPGAEMRAAVEGAAAQALPLWTIDRDVGITLKRTYGAVGFWQRSRLIAGLLASVIDDEKVEHDEIERLKQGDVLESTFSEFAERSEPLYRNLIADRDRYMAAALREEAARSRPREVLAVVGAGHLAGLARELAEQSADPAALRSELRQLPPPSRFWRTFPYLLAGVILTLIGWGFVSGFDVGSAMLRDWVLATASLGALGCLLAGGHPLSIITAALASPFTPLHPLLASGTLSATVELAVRRPRVADFSHLRDDVTRARGWWHNRVTRVLLNFFLTSLGTTIGVYLAGWRMLEALL